MMTRRWMGGGVEVARTGESFVAWLPAEAADTLVVDATLLVVSHMIAGETK